MRNAFLGNQIAVYLLRKLQRIYFKKKKQNKVWTLNSLKSVNQAYLLRNTIPIIIADYIDERKKVVSMKFGIL